MQLYEFKVSLEVEGPVLTHSSVPLKWGIDAPFAKDSMGRPIIPWTLVKGRLLESWTELRTLAGGAFEPDVERLFGVATGSDANIQAGAPPRRGTLRGTDFVLTREEPRQDRILYRIQIDDERGTAQTGMYQVIESPLAPGEPGTFSGTLSIHAASLQDAREVAVWLDKGLRWIPSVGAFKTVGFGSLRKVTVEEPTATKVAKAAPDNYLQDGRVSLAIRFDRPFEISRSQPNSILFESEVVIPGGVLKGAFAATWAESLGKPPWETVASGFDPDRCDLSASFHLIRFTHAVPEENGKRPVHIPFSAVFAGKDRPFDTALASGPGLCDGRAPSFQPDWKDEQEGKARQTFGWPNLETELRVRTAIEKGVAKDKALFAYEAVVPGDRRWIFDIDLSAIDDVDAASRTALQLIELMAHGIRGIGKTKANTSSLDVLLQPVLPAMTGKPRNDGLVVLSLQSDALLFDALALTETSGPADLQKLYEAYFGRTSGASMSLIRYFARQRLAGGWYLHSRFQPGKAYHPLALTEAGSVFVLRIENREKAEKVLDGWRRRGLPIPDSVSKRLERTIDGTSVSGADWRNCPFVPENGWGEVALDLDFHSDRRLDVDGRVNPTPGLKEVTK